MNKDYFLNRRSCRVYSPDKISEKKIEDIISRAMKAPTCGNMQLYSVIITENPENLKKLASYHYNQPAASTAPVILTICADFSRFTKWCEYRNADAGYNNFHSFITALTDAVIFSQQIVTIAEMEGLASCYLGTVTYNAKEISEFLNLPDLVVPVASISLGYPAEECEKSNRLPIKAILHNEHYRQDNEKTILDFYKEEEENPQNQKFIKENSKENLAQVFAEVRYPKEMNEKISTTFTQLLKEKGFI